MPTYLGQNQYGKAEVRVFRVNRDTPTHHVKDLKVSVALSGDMEGTHLTGDNSGLLTTDATKNTVYGFAKEHGIDSPETFGMLLAEHFVTSMDSVSRARIRLEEYSWDRIPRNESRSRFVGADEIAHSFVRNDSETRTSQVTCEVDEHGTPHYEVLSGIKDMTILKSTGSEFWGFAKERFTTLQETDDRILATDLKAIWRYEWAGEAGARVPDWDRCYAAARKNMLEAFAETHSLSLQQSLFQMGTRVIDRRPEIVEIRFSLPNNHNFLVDLEPFGLKNPNEVFFAADRPYGLIEGTVLRDGAEERIPTTE